TASPSAASTVLPWTVPFRDNSATAASRPSFPRAAIATLAPSSRRRDAIARPMPRLPPEITAFLPANPRSTRRSPRRQEFIDQLVSRSYPTRDLLALPEGREPVPAPPEATA